MLLASAIYSEDEPESGAFDHPCWESVVPSNVGTYWSGDRAPAGRHFSFRCVWSTRILGVLFAARQDEPIVAVDSPVLDRKSIGLWDRDVCELFLADGPGPVSRYLEFEAAPNGEWLDLAIDVTDSGLQKDWELLSGMESDVLQGDGSVSIMMRIPWSAFGRAPVEGETWRANFFRIVGAGSERGYLAWSPTRTEEPSFHVPGSFGGIEFVRP